jgi:hypothetical protein
VTFFRQMGGTIGVAAFLSLLFTRLPTDIGNAVEDTVRANPDLAPQFQELGAGTGGSLDDTSFIQRLPETLALPFKVGFSDTMDLVFLVAAGVVALGFLLLVFLPELPLRNVSGIQARQAGAGELAGAPVDDADETVHAAENAAGAAAPTSVPPPAGRPGGATVQGPRQQA